MPPRFTVVVPTYNRSAALRATLDSVRDQREPSWELLVVSDGSTDDTDAVAAAFAAEEPRCQVLRVGPFGAPGGPRNEGWRAARGEWVAWLDHDDTWSPEHLGELRRSLEAGAEWAVSGARRIDRAGEERSVTGPLDAVWHPELQALGPLFEPSRVALRRDLLDVVGGWHEAPGGLEDWDLWLRLADAGRRPAMRSRATAELLDDEGTRRHAMGFPIRDTLAELPDRRTARAALRRLVDPGLVEPTRRAVLGDLRDAYGRWLRDVPDHSLQAPDALERALGEAIAEAPPPWRDVELTPIGERWALTRRLACARPEHAARVGAMVRKTQPRQLALVAAAVRDAQTRRWSSPRSADPGRTSPVS